MKAPRHLWTAWPRLRRELRQARRVALFTDFDGTLVPIRRHPGGVRLNARVRRALSAAVQGGTLVGVVSGRPVGDVAARVGLRAIWYVGAHGFFVRQPSGRAHTLLTAEERLRMARARRLLTVGLRNLPGIGVEFKRATVAVHYRGASPRVKQSAWQAVRAVLAQDRRLYLQHGKKVWELLPNARADKWAAMRFILAKQSGKRRGRWAVVYLGDDTTDERVFQQMHGISVVVGRRRRTAARFFLRSPGEVRQFLEGWSELVS